jgi:hypothetical protein
MHRGLAPDPRTWIRAALVALGLAFAANGMRDLWAAYVSPIGLQDDAYYYLIVARNLATTGQATKELAHLAIAYGGTVSAEHGIGKLKRALIADMVGPEVMARFRRWSALWTRRGSWGVARCSTRRRTIDPMTGIRAALVALGSRSRRMGTRCEAWLRLADRGKWRARRCRLLAKHRLHEAKRERDVDREEAVVQPYLVQVSEDERDDGEL